MKTDIEEDIKICKDFIEENKSGKILLHTAIENILADRERLEKENKKMKIEIAEQVYFGSMQIENMKQFEDKANKYDSLVEEIKEKIEEREIAMSLSDISRNNDYVMQILQELLDTEKE